MITHLQLENFKAWRDTGLCRMAPLTVLFGTNSAGKTSFAQLLLLLKQTAESPDRQRALQFGDDRTYVDLGTFGECVHGHDLRRRMSFRLGWSLPHGLSVMNLVMEHKRLAAKPIVGDHLHFHAVVGAQPKTGQTQLLTMDYSLSRGGNERMTTAMVREEGGNKYDLLVTGFDLERRQGRPNLLPEPTRFYGFPEEIIANFTNAGFTADFSLEMEKLLRSVYYVGPLREYPKRLYLWSGERPDHVGSKGERAVEAILAAGDERKFNLGPKQRLRSLPALVAERMQQMGLIHEFDVKPLTEGHKAYEVLVRTSASAALVKLTDVGFGVGQVLPVIVECFYVPRRSVVIFEQPEIHLHPRVQSELADLFIDAVRARENGQPRECQFIIESHSEHFLRRLQRRIAEGEIDAEDVALYFVGASRETGEATIEPLQVDRYGNILNWPDGFFGDEMEDLVARTVAQSRRMTEDQGK